MIKLQVTRAYDGYPEMLYLPEDVVISVKNVKGKKEDETSFYGWDRTCFYSYEDDIGTRIYYKSKSEFIVKKHWFKPNEIEIVYDKYFMPPVSFMTIERGNKVIFMDFVAEEFGQINQSMRNIIVGELL